MLGVILKQHKLLEVETHKIDKKIEKTSSDHLTEAGLLIKRYGRNYSIAEQLKDQIIFKKTNIVFSETSEQRRLFRKELNNLKETFSLLEYECDSFKLII